MNRGAIGPALDVADCDEHPHYNPLIVISNWFEKYAVGEWKSISSAVH